MEQMTVNWFAVLVASLISFGLGGLWYGPVFGKPWMRSLGMDPEAMQAAAKTGLGRTLGITFVLQFVMALCLALFMGSETDAARGALYGFLTGLPWVAFALAVNALYEQKPASYIFINGGYWTLSFTLMGMVLGAWP